MSPIPIPRHLNRLQLRGLHHLGDVLVPGLEDRSLESFSAIGCSREADRILDHMPSADRRDLKLLLTVTGLLPRFACARLLGLLELSPRWGRWAAPLRFVRLGIRGLILTLYYSHPATHRALGYEVGVHTADLDKSA